MEISPYRGTAGEVQILRDIARAWSKEDFWSFDQCLDFLSHKNNLLYYCSDEDRQSWLAAALFNTSIDVADLVYIYTPPENRGQGLGAKFLLACLKMLNQERGIENVFLEVAANNSIAKHVYDKLNFKKIGERKSYYQNGQDAIVMKLALNEVT